MLLAPLAVTLTLWRGFDPVQHAASLPLIHRDGGFAGSESCLACHPDQHASWAKSFHSTMTQRASPHSVVGEFDGRSVRYEEQEARPFERDGRYFMDIPTPSGRRTAEVVLTVGSRRYQQYFERETRGADFAFLRLPILWHIEARRWLHLNTVFLGPDNSNWDAHAATWNENCIFCHTTAPQPRMTNYGQATRVEQQRFDSEVSDLGIACESCHGPGAEHAARQSDPLRRYAEHLSSESTGDIVHPLRLDQARATAVCGQCHGQRLPQPVSRVAAWLTSGPTFRAGEDLMAHVLPIRRDTPVHEKAAVDMFQLRFWDDGTPRLTAYEYQGVTQSACYLRGEMTCNSCHTMHSGDVRGQLQAPMRGNAACVQCHASIGANVSAHTKHRADSSGSVCMDCHMPRMVYGVIEMHRSHRIENPDPAREAELGRPSACTMCHLDKSSPWAARETARLWNLPLREITARADGADLEMSDAIASLLCGDAVQRASYAAAMGRSEAALAPRDKAFVRVLLAATLGDAYPSVRWLAQRSLLALERELPLGMQKELERIDHTSGSEQRRRDVLETLSRLAQTAPGKLAAPKPGMLVNTDFRAQIEALITLMNNQEKRVIAIGE
jgi:predicted CXXCH cytochrome family protein